jgi:hypothetical protein
MLSATSPSTAREKAVGVRSSVACITCRRAKVRKIPHSHSDFINYQNSTENDPLILSSSAVTASSAFLRRARGARCGTLSASSIGVLRRRGRGRRRALNLSHSPIRHRLATMERAGMGMGTTGSWRICRDSWLRFEMLLIYQGGTSTAMCYSSLA